MKKPYYSFQRRNPIFSACWRKKHRKSCCSLPITLYISLEVQSWWEWWHFIGKEYGKIMITFLFRSLLKVCGNWSPFVVFYSLQSWLYLYVFVLSGGTCNNRAIVEVALSRDIELTKTVTDLCLDHSENIYRLSDLINM